MKNVKSVCKILLYIVVHIVAAIGFINILSKAFVALLRMLWTAPLRVDASDVAFYVFGILSMVFFGVAWLQHVAGDFSAWLGKSTEEPRDHRANPLPRAWKQPPPPPKCTCSVDKETCEYHTVYMAQFEKSS